MYVNSSLQNLKITKELLYWYPWIADLKNKNIWLSLAQQWKSDGSYPDTPPPGYDYYIVTGDSLMFGFAEKISEQTKGKVIQLTGPVTDPGLSTEHVKYVPYTSDHRRINRMPMSDINKDIKHKASALTNRVTQSKAIVFSALSMFLKPSDIILSLHNAHSHDKNVHYWNMSGNLICDEHILNFKNNWADKTMILPNDDRTEGSYNNPAYTNCALNFTQESYHYSYMIENDKLYIQPGPFLTEKTWKCILSKTAFVPVGQYQSYAWLEQMGLNFDYGPLDLSFDSDPGNLTRLEKIVHLIKSLNQWTATDLYEMTRSSCEHNYNHVMNKEFWQQCELFNQPTVDLLTKL